MMARGILFLWLLISAPVLASAGELELYGGVNKTTYDDASDANTWGMTVRAQYNFRAADSSWFVNLYSPGLGPGASELGAGYMWKSQGELFFEGGLGAGYSAIRGPFPVAILGMGYRVTQTVFFDLPIMYTTALVCLPYIGFTF
ncbi:MAG: hypothetical protein AB7H97_09990 [Pseudobdellovibrionaceae bacterium]